MDAKSLGATVFSSLPSWLKGTAVFSRTSDTSYDPVTGISTTNTITATSDVVVQAARGTGSETFLAMTAIREKYIVATVLASKLGSFIPESQDTFVIGTVSFRVTGVETVAPNGTTAAIYRCTAEKING